MKLLQSTIISFMMITLVTTTANPIAQPQTTFRKIHASITKRFYKLKKTVYQKKEQNIAAATFVIMTLILIPSIRYLIYRNSKIGLSSASEKKSTNYNETDKMEEKGGRYTEESQGDTFFINKTVDDSPESDQTFVENNDSDNLKSDQIDNTNNNSKSKEERLEQFKRDFDVKQAPPCKIPKTVKDRLEKRPNKQTGKKQLNAAFLRNARKMQKENQIQKKKTHLTKPLQKQDDNYTTRVKNSSYKNNRADLAKKIQKLKKQIDKLKGEQQLNTEDMDTIYELRNWESLKRRNGQPATTDRGSKETMKHEVQKLKELKSMLKKDAKHKQS